MCQATVDLLRLFYLRQLVRGESLGRPRDNHMGYDKHATVAPPVEVTVVTPCRDFKSVKIMLRFDSPFCSYHPNQKSPRTGSASV